MNDEFMKDLEAVEAAATADETEAAFPEFQNAIVYEDKLPKMPDYIIDGVLLETHKMLPSGPSKAGKTWCLINLAESVACGGYWIGHKCAQRKVLFIDFETDPRTLQRRITVVAKAKQLDQKKLSENLVIWPLRGTTHSLDEIALELIKRCEKPPGFGCSADMRTLLPGGHQNGRDGRGGLFVTCYIISRSFFGLMKTLPFWCNEHNP